MNDHQVEFIERTKNIIVLIAKEVVDKKEAINITHSIGEQTIVVDLYCAKSDLGKLIGKKGSMVNGLRAILYSIAGQCKVRAVLEIKE